MSREKKNKIWAIDRNLLIDIVAIANNLAQILNRFGLSTSSSNYIALKSRLKQENIEYNHIKIGIDSNLGRKFPNKKVISLDDILIENSSYSRSHLKKRLLKGGLLKNECACGQGSEWKGKPLTMQIDHINGISNDNRLNNLRMICPNCHSQTETFSGRNAIRISSNGKTGRSE